MIYSRSQTELRREAAQNSIPDFVDELIRGDRPITFHNVGTLYREYRAYHCGKPPFRLHFDHVQLEAEEMFEGYTPQELLDMLRSPASISRRSALVLLWSLMYTVNQKQALTV